MRILIVIFTTMLVLTGCSSTNSSRATQMRIQYGEIVNVTRVPIPSAAPAGAIVGGFTGLVLSQGSSPGRRVAAGVGGAALGGLAVSALEGDRRAYQYRIRLNSGSETDYITENGFFMVGDCIAIERRDHANLRRVSSALCESPPRAPEVIEKRNEEANLCHEAKEQLLRAVTDEEIERESRKVRILCQF
ncbi:MAG: hypothetical protein KJN90_06425 [Gammaproteobacteria bacterium]|nr:hypothetical protein [Gammaproteobacteria bacterium]